MSSRADLPSIVDTKRAKQNTAAPPDGYYVVEGPGLPPKFKLLTRNAYRFRRQREVQEDDIAVCGCENKEGDPQSACGFDQCINALLCVECHPGHCPCGLACRNQRFQRLQFLPTRVRQVEGRGWGLFADQHMKSGQFVMEYCGEVIPNNIAHKRLEAYQKAGLRHVYTLKLSAAEVVDPTRRGSPARFINHSCDPNCEIQKWTVLGETRVGVFTRRPISPGQELTYDYNFEWYGGEKVRCRCGASTCQGFIGARSRGFQEDASFWAEEDERFVVEQVPLYDSSTEEEEVEGEEEEGPEEADMGGLSIGHAQMAGGCGQNIGCIRRKGSDECTKGSSRGLTWDYSPKSLSEEQEEGGDGTLGGAASLRIPHQTAPAVSYRDSSGRASGPMGEGQQQRQGIDGEEEAKWEKGEGGGQGRKGGGALPLKVEPLEGGHLALGEGGCDGTDAAEAELEWVAAVPRKPRTPLAAAAAAAAGGDAAGGDGGARNIGGAGAASTSTFGARKQEGDGLLRHQRERSSGGGRSGGTAGDERAADLRRKKTERGTAKALRCKLKLARRSGLPPTAAGAGAASSAAPPSGAHSASGGGKILPVDGSRARKRARKMPFGSYGGLLPIYRAMSSPMDVTLHGTTHLAAEAEDDDGEEQEDRSRVRRGRPAGVRGLGLLSKEHEPKKRMSAVSLLGDERAMKVLGMPEHQRQQLQSLCLSAEANSQRICASGVVLDEPSQQATVAQALCEVHLQRFNCFSELLVCSLLRSDP